MKVGVIIWFSAVFCMSGGDFLISCIFQFFFSKISIISIFPFRREKPETYTQFLLYCLVFIDVIKGERQGLNEVKS